MHVRKRDVSTAFAQPSDYRARRGAPEADAAIAVVCTGSRVTVRRGILVSDYWIVTDDEADPRRGRIAAASGLGRALIGARVGEAVEYHAGGRIEEIRVLAVRPA